MTYVTLTFDLWPWPFAWTSRRSMVMTPENFRMIQWWKPREKGVTDGWTDRQTDRKKCSKSCLVAAKMVARGKRWKTMALFGLGEKEFVVQSWQRVRARRNQTICEINFRCFFYFRYVRRSKSSELRLTENAWEAYRTGAIRWLRRTGEMEFGSDTHFSLFASFITFCKRESWPMFFIASREPPVLVKLTAVSLSSVIMSKHQIRGWGMKKGRGLWITYRWSILF